MICRSEGGGGEGNNCKVPNYSLVRDREIQGCVCVCSEMYPFDVDEAVMVFEEED